MAELTFSPFQTVTSRLEVGIAMTALRWTSSLLNDGSCQDVDRPDRPSCLPEPDEPRSLRRLFETDNGPQPHSFKFPLKAPVDGGDHTLINGARSGHYP
jgi:hypothetical protein